VGACNFFVRGVGRDDKRRSYLRIGGKGWLEPWIILRTYRKAFCGMPLPRELSGLLKRTFSGRELYLYVR